MKSLFVFILASFFIGQSVLAQTTAAHPSEKKETTTTYNGSLHLVVPEAQARESVVLKWHPNYPQNAAGRSSVRISTVHFASISSSGRANNVLECGVTMGVEVKLDGATSAKISVLKEQFPSGEFAFVVDNKVVAVLTFIDGISNYNLVIPVTSDYQAQQIEALVKHNNGR
ncbi:MAG: hypothetical protein ACFCUH_09185 [Flavobacteriales bacterium]